MNVASKLSIFFAELKRRKVYRVAVVYVVVGLGILGAAEVTLDPLGLEALRPYIVILVLLGFPIALVLAWAYEVKPEEPRVADKAPVPAIDTSEAEQRKSIVVLPFDNMSPDPNDAYFSDGLTEEIITNLSYLHSLRVISRNSAMVLKGTQKDTRTIAAELDVQYVLEGSVRKAGDDLRITAQLIDASADEHLWAEKYDGVLDDVFGMQEQVSRSIVAALELELRSEEEQRLVERPIDDLQAYECYLRARHELMTMSEGSLHRSLELVERGLEAVGDNDLLYVAKGMALFQMVNSMSKAPETYEGLLEEAQQCAERALAINPDSAPGHTLQGLVLVNSGNPQGAVRHFTEALRLDPDNTDALGYLGFLGAIGGWDLEGSRLLLEKVATLDPLTPYYREASSWLHWFEGDFGAALEGFRAFLKQMEEVKSPWSVLTAYLHAAQEDLAEAARIVDQMIDDSPGHIITSLAAFLKHAWLGEKEAALDAVTADLERGAWWDDLWPLLMADAYALIDEQDRAFFWLDHAIEYGMTNVKYLGDYDPFLAGLRSDDRFGKLMQKASSLSESLSALVNIEELV